MVIMSLQGHKGTRKYTGTSEIEYKLKMNLRICRCILEMFYTGKKVTIERKMS